MPKVDWSEFRDTQAQLAAARERARKHGVAYAPLIKATRTDGTWLIFVRCPFCDHDHMHGGGTGEDLSSVRDFLGARAPHCGSAEVCSRRREHGHVHQPSKQYMLTDTNGLLEAS